MGTTDFDITDESGDDRPDELGLAGSTATHTEHGRVTIRGNTHDRATDTWTVWIETDGDVIETTGDQITEVGT